MNLATSRLARAVRYICKRLILGTVNLLAPPFHISSLDRFRRWLLARIGARIGNASFISASFYVLDGRNFSMGERGNLGAFARIWDFWPVRIGHRLLASHNLTIVAGTHETTPPFRDLPGPVTIGDNVWIGVNVTITGPCTIPDRCIIGANSFVTGDLPGPGIYAGSPAKLKRALTDIPPQDNTAAG